jgi:hypothetical protein
VPRSNLHYEIERVLRLNDGGPMSAPAIARAVDVAARYRKRDGSSVAPEQIHARVSKHPERFERTPAGFATPIRPLRPRQLHNLAIRRRLGIGRGTFKRPLRGSWSLKVGRSRASPTRLRGSAGSTYWPPRLTVGSRLR